MWCSTPSNELYLTLSTISNTSPQAGLYKSNMPNLDPKQSYDT